MKKQFYPYFKGSTLITSLLVLMLAILFFYNAKDKFILQGRYIESDYKTYLKSRLELSKQLDNIECPFDSSDFSENIKKLNYNYHCTKNGLFLTKPPTKKHIKISNIDTHIDLKKVKIHITDLEQLPESSLDNPQIVIIEKELSGKLAKDFYGIIITSYPLTFGLGGKFYGVLYSPFDIDKNTSRYITFNKAVIKQIISDYTDYLPNSKNVINAEK